MTGVNTKNRPLATYVCGNTGSGKSCLLQRNILWDIAKQHGVCVIDPTEQLINVVLSHLPKSRLDDVVYFETSIGIPLDFFSYRDDDERQELVRDISDIIDIQDAKIARHYIRKILIALFEANANNIPKRCTVFDILSFVQNEGRRKEILKHCHPEREYDHPPHVKIQPDTISAIIMRMSILSDNPTTRKVLGASEGGINVADLINGNKIFLVKLRRGEAEQIVGSIIATKIQHAIFARLKMPDITKATPYYLYIDECHKILSFAEDRFDDILLEARKCKLCLTMANALPTKLPKKIQESMGTIGNKVIFQLNEKDASIFKSEIAPYRPDYLQNFPPFHAIFRTGNQVQLIKTPQWLPSLKNGNAEDVRTRTLQKYACKSEPISHTSEDGPKPDPQPEAKIPHDESQTRGAHAPRGVFRPPDKRSSSAPKKPNNK